MQLVILAAGRGTRLGQEAFERPKSLVSIGQEPYLAYQLRSFDRFSFRRKVIVGGFGIGEIAEFLRQRGTRDYQLIENRDFEKGNLYSLAAARNSLDDDFFVFNADHFYSPQNYQRILTTTGEDIVIFCDRDRPLGDDDMKVHSVTEGAVGNRLSSMAKTLVEYDCGYVGVTFVPRARHERYWQAFDETAKLIGDKANVESVLNRLSETHETVRVADISGSWWTEIDTPADLAGARTRILQATDL